MWQLVVKTQALEPVRTQEITTTFSRYLPKREQVVAIEPVKNTFTGKQNKYG